MNMKFFIKCNPPTATAQEKKVAMVHGRPVFYEPAKLKAAKKTLMVLLQSHTPREPLTGPLALHVVWRFPKGKSHKDGEWRVTRPDTDNLEKMLKDCMTRCGYWNDDAQVVKETAEKRWSDEPTGIEIEITEAEVQV
jgi:crossover junction endodeoxyribonuclease RusA